MARKKKLSSEAQRALTKKVEQTNLVLSRAMDTIHLVAPGDDEGVDALRTFLGSIMLFPEGSWDLAKLPVKIKWKAIPETVLADTALSSCRKDVVSRLPLKWDALMLPSGNELLDFFPSRSVHTALCDTQHQQSNWLVSRLFCYGSLLNSRPGLYDISPSALQEKFFDTISSVGIGPDTLIQSQVTGQSTPQRLFDISLLYDAPRIQAKLFPNTTWDTPQQVANTLFALSLRWTIDECESAPLPVWLKNYELIEVLLEKADPMAPIDLSWRMERILSIRENEDAFLAMVMAHEGTRPDPTSIPLALVLPQILYLCHDNADIEAIPAMSKLLQWCERSIISNPELLNQALDLLIIPSLNRRLESVSDTRQYGWDMTGFIEKIAKKLPEEQRNKIVREGFNWMLNALKGDRCIEKKVIDEIFPVKSSLPRGVLDLEDAQRLMPTITRINISYWIHKSYNLDKVLDLFEPSARSVLAQRIEEIKAAIKKGVSGGVDLLDLDKRMKLEGKVALVPQRTDEVEKYPLTKPKM